MLLSALCFAIGLAASIDAAPTVTDSACNALWEKMPKQLANLTVYAAEAYPDNTTFVDPTGFDSVNSTSGIAAFCRFGATIRTSNMSEVAFEVWLPPNDTWNGRFSHQGNGGDSGSIFYNAMSTLLTRYHFAVASTNTGHFGDSGNGSFALNNPESQIDFGYRAVHLSTVYSKAVVDTYYGKKAAYSYWNGCSSGGKQGLKEAQDFPDDFDGILAGAPASSWSRLNAFTMHINAVNALNSTGYIPPTTFPLINAEVIQQCDLIDGVQDQVINDPRKCNVDVSALTCGSLSNSSALNSTTCLSAAQVTTLNNVYTNYTNSQGDLVFPTFEPGSEYLWAASVNGRPYGPAPSYFLYQVQNVTTLQLPYDFPPLNVTASELEQLTAESLVTDPGRTNAIKTPKPFFKKGGKMIQYHGWADWLIPSESSLVTRANILKDNVTVDELDKSYRLYMVPGLGHCSTGPGPVNFGGASQVLGPNGTGQALQSDSKHDMILALMDWVENGNAPEEIIAVRYKQNDQRLGAEFTRPLCNYPKLSVYKGDGHDDTLASSFDCK